MNESRDYAGVLGESRYTLTLRGITGVVLAYHTVYTFVTHEYSRVWLVFCASLIKLLLHVSLQSTNQGSHMISSTPLSCFDHTPSTG